MSIPEASVEAAAKLAYMKTRPGGDWGTEEEVVRKAFRDGERPYTEAGAPFIAAQAWEEGRKAGSSPFKEKNPYEETR